MDIICFLLKETRNVDSWLGDKNPLDFKVYLVDCNRHCNIVVILMV